MIVEITSKEDIEKFVSSQKGGEDESVEQTVKQIIRGVKTNGDRALNKYIRDFDRYDASEGIVASKEEIEKASGMVPEEDRKLILDVKERLEAYHRATLPRSLMVEQEGVILMSRVTPCRRCGLYVPGGKAAYPSTALMTIIPAAVAGVDEIFIATPPAEGTINPYVAYISSLFNIQAIYKMGGAHAIAAMAYGTESVKKVDVIAGPGNIYVATAKKLVFGDVNIDSIAGPSEVMVVVDESANDEYVAHDLLSQAEHDELARCWCASTNKEKLTSIRSIFMELAEKASRNHITRVSSKNAQFFLVKDNSLMCELVDAIAPEHLELQVKDPYMFMNRIRNAGAIFIGEYSPEPIGDYIAGPNHTLPTNSTARFFSPLSCETFMKKSSVIHYSREAFLKEAPLAARFARIEGLMAHEESITVRLNNADNKTDAG